MPHSLNRIRCVGSPPMTLRTKYKKQTEVIQVTGLSSIPILIRLLSKPTANLSSTLSYRSNLWQHFKPTLRSSSSKSYSIKQKRKKKKRLKKWKSSNYLPSLYKMLQVQVVTQLIQLQQINNKPRPLDGMDGKSSWNK